MNAMIWTPGMFESFDQYLEINHSLVAMGFHPRSYPLEFGRNLRRAWETHTTDGAGSGPGRRDLRFKPQFNKNCEEVVQFDLLPLGDAWDEAELLPAVSYLMTSKKCRSRLVDMLITSMIQSNHVFQTGGFQKSGKRRWMHSTKNCRSRPALIDTNYSKMMWPTC